jgi:hypothetical protein
MQPLRLTIFTEEQLAQIWVLLGALGERLRSMGHDTSDDLLVDGVRAFVVKSYSSKGKVFASRVQTNVAIVVDDTRHFRASKDGTFNVDALAKAVSEAVAQIKSRHECRANEDAKIADNRAMALRVLKTMGYVDEGAAVLPSRLRNMEFNVSSRGVEIRICVKFTDDEGTLRCMLDELGTIGVIWRDDDKGESIWR